MINAGGRMESGARTVRAVLWLPLAVCLALVLGFLGFVVLAYWQFDPEDGSAAVEEVAAVSAADVPYVYDTSKLPKTRCDEAFAFARASMPAGAREADCRNSPSVYATTVIVTFKMPSAESGAWTLRTYPETKPWRPCPTHLEGCGVAVHDEREAAAGGTAVRVKYGVSAPDGHQDVTVEFQASAPPR